MARKRRSYSAEAVRLVIEEGLKPVRVARDLDIPESSLSRGVNQARIDVADSGEAGGETHTRVDEVGLTRI